MRQSVMSLTPRSVQAMSDAELLALCLRPGRDRQAALLWAQQLVHKFGGLRPLFDAELTQICNEPGLGPVSYQQLQAVLELGRRHLASQVFRCSALESPQAVRDYLKACLRHEPHEVFACLFLDTKHRVLAFETLFYGSIDGAAVYPRQVVKRALVHNAAALILTHNHPSGEPEPSDADRQLTRQLKEALALVEVRVLDHFVVGEGEPVSLAELGWL
ncbi:MAG: RadC family protein [Pseudomonas sp.]